MEPFALANKTQEYDEAQTLNVKTLGAGATVYWNLQTQQNAELTLTQNVVMAAPTGWKKGRMAMLEIIQGAAGNYTVAWSTQFVNLGIVSIMGTAGYSNLIIVKCIDNGKFMVVSNNTCNRTS